MEEQKDIEEMGGTMRLGAYDCELSDGSLARDAYREELVQERHRHRYEVNNNLRYRLREEGMRFTGVNPQRDLVEIVELPEKRWYLGVQFHPEFNSRVQDPHPLFVSFIQAAVAYADEHEMLERPRPPRREKRIRLASANV